MITGQARETLGGGTGPGMKPAGNIHVSHALLNLGANRVKEPDS